MKSWTAGDKILIKDEFFSQDAENIKEYEDCRGIIGELLSEFGNIFTTSTGETFLMDWSEYWFRRPSNHIEKLEKFLKISGYENNSKN